MSSSNIAVGSVTVGPCLRLIDDPPKKGRRDSAAFFLRALIYNQLATPPWPVHALVRVVECQYVPSTHRAMAPLESVFG